MGKKGMFQVLTWVTITTVKHITCCYISRQLSCDKLYMSLLNETCFHCDLSNLIQSTKFMKNLTYFVP